MFRFTIGTLAVWGAGLMLAGCAASGPRFQEAQHTDNQAVIYVYRGAGFPESAVMLGIDVDGQSIGCLHPNGYLYKVVPAGAHMVSSKTESESAVEVLAKGGHSYYIEAQVIRGFLMGEPKLSLVPVNLGRADIGGKNYSGVPEAQK